MLYKTLSLLLASVFLNNLGAHQSFADNTEIPTNTEMENVLATNDENIEATNSEENLDSEASFEDISNETENSNSVDEELNSANEIEPEVCGLGDIELFSPLSWDILKGEFEISWNYKKTICEEIPLIVKLWDANTQYVTIWEVDSWETSLNFDSSLLYSWYYDITWLNLSGEVIIIHTWEYIGLNTRYFSWHKIVIYSSDMEVLYEWEEFTIDNEAPSLSGVELNTDVTSWNYIWLGKKVSVSFSANEELSWVVVNILWIDADLENKENNNYEYISYLSEGHTTGNIIYNIEFEDLAGNTWILWMIFKCRFW